MIRFAKKNDIPNIISLWDEAFPEEKSFNKYFFENIFNVEYTLIMTENNRLLSMAQLLPYSIRDIGAVSYIYGAATDIKYRNMGCMQRLLKASFEYDISLGRKASILIPANKGLFDYYSKAGYVAGFYNNIAKYKNTNEYKFSFRKAQYDDIDSMLNIYKGDIIREYNYFKTQMDMFRALDGDVFVLCENDTMLSYAFVWKNEAIDIQEISGDHTSFNIMANYIMKYYNKEKAKATLFDANNEFGMIKYHSAVKHRRMTMNLMYN